MARMMEDGGGEVPLSDGLMFTVTVKRLRLCDVNKRPRSNGGIH